MIGYEGAIADGFIVVWDQSIAEAPPENADYHELWSWARRQHEVHFIPFDVKVMSLGDGSDWQAGHYYTWTSPRVRNEEQSEHVQFIVAMVEGIDDHMAIVPTKTWFKAREISYGAESIIHGLPLWLLFYLIADHNIEAAFQKIVRRAMGGQSEYNNPTVGNILRDWEPTSTTAPLLDPSDFGSAEKSFTDVLKLWREVTAVGGEVFFNPFAPNLVDFLISLPEVGMLWWEHKALSVPAKNFAFDVDVRRNPFRKRRMWHILYCQASDGILCIARDDIKHEWSNHTRLPAEVVPTFKKDNLQDALDYIKAHANPSRRAVKLAISRLEPSDINEGLPTTASAAALKSDMTYNENDDPLIGLLIRQRTAPGVSTILNRWCRTLGRGTVLALGGSNPVSTHALLEHTWTIEDEFRFDEFGRLPLTGHSKSVRSRVSVPLRIEDHTLPSNVKPIWYPFAIRKEDWKIPVELPRYLILGSLIYPSVPLDLAARSSWMLLMPSGFTSMYTKGNFRQEASAQSRKTGEHMFRRVYQEQSLVPEPRWPSKRSTSSLNAHFFVDKDINPSRYVLNLLDGTVNKQIYQVLDSPGRNYISNPLFRKTQNREFDANEYRIPFGDLLQLANDIGCKFFSLLS